MSYQVEEMDYAPADYEMGEVEEDMYFAGRIMGGDTESEDEDEHDNLVSSTAPSNFMIVDITIIFSIVIACRFYYWRYVIT